MKGVLLGNLGTPQSPNQEDVKEYLDEFLMDERALDVPYWLRSLIVRGIILRTRPKKSAANYKRVWSDEGSPLLVYLERLGEKVNQYTNVPVEIAMRYGQPSIKSGLQKLVDKGVDEVYLLPLYPQYAMATTETFVALAEKLKTEHFPQLNFTTIPSFYNNASYINVLAKSIREQLEDIEYDHLLFSYHGVPERHIRKTDITDGHCKMDDQCCQAKSPAHNFCYRHQCLETTAQVARILRLDKDKYSNSFQSRLGFDPWLKPFTDETIEKLAKEEKKKLAVVTPAFVADCIETLDEIDREARETFMENGGKEFVTIPCLNDRDDWAKVIAEWVQNWEEMP